MEQVQEALTRREIARRLGVTVRTLDRYRKKGRISLEPVSKGHYSYTVRDDKAEVALSALKRLNSTKRRLERLERSIKELEQRSITGMLEAHKAVTEQEEPSERQTEHVAPYDILFLTRAYNKDEISFDDWLEQASIWAERMIEQHSNGKTK
jgi:DNA-binding transcriptional MerR regulator